MTISEKQAPSRSEVGVCYYPEHWPEEIWQRDAEQMASIGLSWVRIGEFAWSRIEPRPGDFDFDWLDRAIDILAQAGLKIVLGTPTATPPRWMVDKHPDMLAYDSSGQPRGFGSRRHYCFAYTPYYDECSRIAGILASRYGQHPAVQAWQTDNEYGCHDTVLSYSESARTGFQTWLRGRYQTVEALNSAWGNIFWSMEYASFSDIGLPVATVTEANPAHHMAYRRFMSDAVVAFNKAQVDAIRAHSDRPICHNYMGRVTSFDHFAVGRDLDFASWDSYPLGFLADRISAPQSHKDKFMRQGDPDFQAFHHDLYRAVGHGRWWVMEQQPGPVNWAPYNPEPLAGMVRLWGWEAVAHGAETVMYFRWRQAPFAQEQMHAGLLRPDSSQAAGYAEAEQLASELSSTEYGEVRPAPIAILFDYDADAAWDIQPQGQGLSYFNLVFDIYRYLRRLGFSIDILPSNHDRLSGYQAIFVPGMMMVSDEVRARLAGLSAQIIYGPRTGAKTSDFSIPEGLPPAHLQALCRVLHSETLPQTAAVNWMGGGQFSHWVDACSSDAEQAFMTEAGKPALISDENSHYLAGWPDFTAFSRLMGWLNDRGGFGWSLDVLPDGLRCRKTTSHVIWINYDDKPATTPAGQQVPPTDIFIESLQE